MIKHFQLNNSEKSRNFAKTNDVQAKPNNESFSLALIPQHFDLTLFISS